MRLRGMSLHRMSLHRMRVHRMRLRGVRMRVMRMRRMGLGRIGMRWMMGDGMMNGRSRMMLAVEMISIRACSTLLRRELLSRTLLQGRLSPCAHRGGVPAVPIFHAPRFQTGSKKPPNQARPV